MYRIFLVEPMLGLLPKVFLHPVLPHGVYPQPLEKPLKKGVAWLGLGIRIGSLGISASFLHIPYPVQVTT